MHLPACKLGVHALHTGTEHAIRRINSLDVIVLFLFSVEIDFGKRHGPVPNSGGSGGALDW